MKKLVGALLLIAVVAAVLYFYTQQQDGGCPIMGSAKSVRVRELNELKNRTDIPAISDFDNNVSLEKLIKPGYDKNRWSTGSAGEITGYVKAVMKGGVETCNCEAQDLAGRDTHIELVTDLSETGDRGVVIAEVTPRMRKLMQDKGIDWSTETLKNKLTGRKVKIKGWLLFDFEHQRQAGNTNPNGSENWRATCWEIHPITSIEVLDEDGGKGPL
jgi:hypothetical protein